METVRHLYIHIPYCHRICPYCSFHKHTPGRADFGRFVDAVLAELRVEVNRLKVSGIHPGMQTIYFGGGTPTLLPRDTLRRLLDGVRSVIDEAGGTIGEWTVEANPRTVGEAKAKLMREAGVTRLSIGVQAWDPMSLGILGRDHSPEEAEELFTVARAAGFHCLNIDLMFGVPRQSLDTWRANLEKTLSLGPDHISAYNLTYEEDTQFMEKFRKGEFRQDSDDDAEFYRLAHDTLEAAGFRHYEISNYARPGFESEHNRGYWRGQDYLGIGPGAVSTVRNHRWKNAPDTSGYVDRLCAGSLPARDEEVLAPEDSRIERLALGLRTDEGVESSHLNPGAALDSVVEEGLVIFEDGRVRLSEEGRQVADEVVAYIL